MKQMITKKISIIDSRSIPYGRFVTAKRPTILEYYLMKKREQFKIAVSNKTN